MVADAEPDPLMLRKVVVIAAIIAVLAFIPPFINLTRYRTRISQAMSESIGRFTAFSDVHFRLLPQPSFVFSDFVVAEDPDFGAEPMLRAQEVTAALRLTSLWRGRLEISRLSFDSPSLNLVRNERGVWNVGGSIRQAATVPAAPTGERRPTTTPRFPYIEASDARVNFKFGLRKQAFTLTEADLSFWLASPNHWEMRLEARPVRTDAYLGDTGLLRASASFVRERGEPIDDVPLKATVHWDNAQLGQATWLLTGEDRGWRGDLDVRAELTGTPQLLHAKSELRVNSFRRYDNPVTEPLSGRATCNADLVRTSTATDMRFAWERMECVTPIGNGSLKIAGQGSWADRSYDVSVAAEDLPVASIVQFYRHAKLNVSDSLAGTGTLKADLHFRSGLPCLMGKAALREASIVDPRHEVNLSFGNVEVLVPAAPQRKTNIELPCLQSTRASLDLDGGRLLSAGVAVYRWGALLNVSGSAAANKLLSAAKSLGLIVRDYRASGIVDVNADLRIEPSQFKEARWTGTASSAKITFPQDITLRNAVVDLQNDAVSLRQFTTTFPDLESEVSGSVHWPLPCDVTPCPARFDLHATALDLDALNRALNPSFRTRNWFYLPRFLGGKDATASPMSVLLLFRGTGRLSVDHLSIKKAILNNVAADVTWDHDRLTLANMSGGLLNGKLAGRAQVDFTEMPKARGHVELRDVELSATTPWVSFPWARGKAIVAADFSFMGSNRGEILDSLNMQGTFTVRDGTLRHFSTTGDLAFRMWNGTLAQAKRSLEIPESKMITSKEDLQLSGKVSQDLSLDLRITGGHVAYAVGGTLHAPQLTPAARTPVAASNPANDQLTQKKRRASHR